MNDDDKKTVIDVIKSINLDEMTIPDDAHRKWFKFGAYDMARLISERVKDMPLPDKTRNALGIPVLFIDTWSSMCGNCGYPCDPDEKKHITNLGWSESIRNMPGCGITWERVSSNYSGKEVEDWCKKIRPDLPYVPFFEALKESHEHLQKDN